MPLAALVFDTDTDRVALETATHAADWKNVVWELDQHLRNKLKYGHSYASADEALQAVREFLNDATVERSLSLWGE